MTIREASNNALGDADVEVVHYWTCAAGENACMWDNFYERGVIGLGWSDVGNLHEYADKEEIRKKLLELYGRDTSYTNTSLALWQFANVMKPGDVIFLKCGRSKILGRGIVESDYEFSTEDNSGYPHIRRVKWTHKGNWHVVNLLPTKTLTDITDYTNNVSEISAFFEDEDGNIEETATIDYPPYSKADFLSEVFISETSYNTLAGLLRAKMNVILQGAPGVGKTYLAKRLAYSMMGVKDVERVKMVQFHQSYSYEDFIMGFRPSSSGFELKKGVFYTFCKRAEEDSDNDYFFIIDEINRGNLSKIFGELFMLIECDKRGNRNKLQLLYSDEMFSVPDNLYIIGMMNTADRSLAMLDYALRRRFAFFDLKPEFSSEGFRSYREGLGSRKFDALIRCVEELNSQISDDDTLGEGFCIGHSYFCNISPDELNDDKLSCIIEYELIPLLKEYWFDEPLKVREWSDNLRNAVR